MEKNRLLNQSLTQSLTHSPSLFDAAEPSEFADAILSFRNTFK